MAKQQNEWRKKAEECADKYLVEHPEEAKYVTRESIIRVYMATIKGC